jgi:hypothetical protein
MGVRFTFPVVLMFGSVAIAQETGGWLIQTGGPVSPSNPVTTVEVWAWFDDPSGLRDAFAIGDLDMVAREGVFDNARVRIAAMRGSSTPGGDPGQALGPRVNDILVFQWWGGAGLLADTSNPILVWSAEWGTLDFAPRTINLFTENTSTFMIGTNSSHVGMNTLELYPSGFQPGSGVIRVIPAPPASAPLAALIAVGLRRRR